MEQRDIANTDRSDRVPMVGIAQGDVLCPLGLRGFTLLPVLESHFQRDFNGIGTITAKENVVKFRWCDFDQLPRQADRCAVAAPQVGNMRNQVYLLAKCIVKNRVSMAMNVAPETADPVDEFIAMNVLEPTATRRLHDKGLVVLHLGKRMPNVVAVPFFQS